MLSIIAPTRDPEADFEKAIRHRREETASLLRGSKDHVIHRYAGFDELREKPIVPDGFDPKCANSHALRSNYDLTQVGRPLAELREAAFSSANFGLCGLCGRARASTIDHFLPKQWFPEYSILHLNLIPCCDPCNRNKSEKLGDERGNFLYPYGLSGGGVPLLTCSVEVGISGIFFGFDANESLPVDIAESVRYHISELDLHEAYSSAAQLEMAEHANLFVEAHELYGEKGTLSEVHTIIRSISRKFPQSYWKLAMYRGLADCAEFIRNPQIALVA